MWPYLELDQFIFLHTFSSCDILGHTPTSPQCTADKGSTQNFTRKHSRAKSRFRTFWPHETSHSYGSLFFEIYILKHYFLITNNRKGYMEQPSANTVCSVQNVIVIVGIFWIFGPQCWGSGFLGNTLGEKEHHNIPNILVFLCIIKFWVYPS